MGAGATGIETVAELASQYPKKKIGLALKGNRLLAKSKNFKAHCILEEYLMRKKVSIHYNKSYQRELFPEYEHVIHCTGPTFHTEYMRDYYSSCIAPSGEIYVNDFMQITYRDPSKGGNLPAAA